MSSQSVFEVEGWYADVPNGPHLVGRRCTVCGSVFFPPLYSFCKNPRCGSPDVDDVALGRRGRLWSWTTNEFAPPPPYVAGDPFVPYTVAAVELESERMIVLGQLAHDADPSSLRTGAEMEVVIETLYERDGVEHLVWKWKPVGEAAATDEPKAEQEAG